MSGIEVAGLVLGAIPICKLALNGINQTTSTINRFRKWRDEIPRYVTDLELVRIRLRHSLRLLFSLCGRELPDLDHLEQDQTGLVWKDEDVARDLRQNHSDIYIPVERDVLVMQELLEVLCKKLGLGFSVKVSLAILYHVRLCSFPRCHLPTSLVHLRAHHYVNRYLSVWSVRRPSVRHARRLIPQLTSSVLTYCISASGSEDVVAGMVA